MSHVATLDLCVTDLEALKRACERLNLRFNEGATSYKWYGKWVQDYDEADAAYKHGIKPEDYGRCKHSISIPGDSNAYEVGVVPDPKGEGFLLILDFYGALGQKMAKIVGQDCSKLAQWYAAEVSLEQASPLVQAGWDINTTEQDNGDIEIELVDPDEQAQPLI